MENEAGKPTVVETLIQRYEHSAVLRALVQLIPYGIGSAVEAMALTKANNIRRQRAKIFFDELGKGERDLCFVIAAAPNVV